MYKVNFKGSKAVSSQEVDFSNKVDIKFDYSTGKKEIRSITIFAIDEQESIDTATDIVNHSK